MRIGNKDRLPTVLFLGQLPPPVHGVSLMNSYLLNSELIKCNFNIDVIGLQFETSLNQLGKFSIKKVLKAFDYGFKIAKHNLRTKPDLVYFTLVPTGFAFYRDAFYVILLKLFNLKIVLHLHGKGIEENSRNNRIKEKLYTWILRRTHVICLSEKLSEDIKKVYKSTPFIVPNGIEVQPYFNPEIQKTDNKVLRILYLSNYIKSKGILILVEALAILKSRGYQFHARFVGAPFDVTVELLQDHLRKYTLENFAEIVGPLNGDEKLTEYKRADIFVFPTYFEAFGLVNLEAMQYSLPVISTYEGSIPDVVINNETGFLVEKQNPQMLADKISVLLNDQKLRVSMGKKGYERFIGHYTLQHFESNINTIFQTVVNTS